MARIRSLKPDIFTDDELAQLPPLARLAFMGLWCQADKAGRLEDRPAKLKVQILPYDDVDFDEVIIGSLAAANFLTRYVAPDGRRLIQIRSFAKHQRPRDDEPESVLPAPSTRPAASPARGPARVRDRSAEPIPSQDSGAIPSQVTRQSLDSDGHVTPQSVGREGEGKERKGRDLEICAEPTDGSTPQVVLWFPINGDGPGGRWPLTARHIATWSEQFEGLDILGQCKQALAWVEANLGRRKTAKGMPQFLVGWFTRTVNKRGTSAAAASTNGRNPNAGHPADEPSWQVECRELGHVPPCGHGMDCFRRQQQERSR